MTPKTFNGLSEGSAPGTITSAASIQLQALLSRISAINELAAALNRSLRLEKIIDILKQQVKWMIDFDHCSIYLREHKDKKQKVVLFGEELSPLHFAGHKVNLLELAVTQRRPYLVQGYPFAIEASPYRSWLAMPFESEAKVWGAIAFASAHPEHYSQEDMRIAHLLAIQLGNTIRNAYCFAEINQLYAELDRAYQNLQHAQQSRNDMMQMIVHDLCNPLNVMKVSLELLSELPGLGELPPAHQIIERAQRASRHMYNLVRDLLDLSRLENGSYSFDLATLDLQHLLSAMIDDWYTRAAAEQKSLHLELPTALPMLYADGRLLQRVIENLVDNAFKYTLANSVIDVCVQIGEQDWQFSVRDNGVGIAPEYHARVFDKFVQISDHSRPIAAQGFGLGLAFCKLAVEAHGGHIAFESALQQGSTFTISLPRL
jgi:signal transduction histidine kinase